jgi:hypothetical protein
MLPVNPVSFLSAKPNPLVQASSQLVLPMGPNSWFTSRSSSIQEPEYISKMYFGLWEPPGVSERLLSVNLAASIWVEYQTLGGLSGWPSE